MDADVFRHILTSTKYEKENKDFRNQTAILAKKLASEIVDRNSLEAYVNWRMIPLNNNPGARRLGIGELLRRIIRKVIGWVLKGDA